MQDGTDGTDFCENATVDSSTPLTSFAGSFRGLPRGFETAVPASSGSDLRGRREARKELCTLVDAHDGARDDGSDD